VDLKTLFKPFEYAVIPTLPQAQEGKKQVINRERYLRLAARHSRFSAAVYRRRFFDAPVAKLTAYGLQRIIIAFGSRIPSLAASLDD
jgi:hypothetical protein